MIVEDAIKLAMDRVRTLFGGSDHRLEEIEALDNGDFVVTVSYRSPDAPRPLPLGRESVTSGLAESYSGRKAAIGIDASRTYKDVAVSKDGVVKRVSMRHIVLG
jgi:hypothetical protein